MQIVSSVKATGFSAVGVSDAAAGPHFTQAANIAPFGLEFKGLSGKKTGILPLLEGEDFSFDLSLFDGQNTAGALGGIDIIGGGPGIQEMVSRLPAEDRLMGVAIDDHVRPGPVFVGDPSLDLSGRAPAMGDKQTNFRNFDLLSHGHLAPHPGTVHISGNPYDFCQGFQLLQKA